MTTSSTTILGQVDEGADFWFRRIMSSDAGVALTQSSVSSIDLYVYQGNNKTAIYTAPALTYTPANSMYDTLGQDGWTPGGAGYNFKARVPATAFTADGGENYRFEFKFTLASSNGVAWARFLVYSVPVTQV